MPIAFLSYQSRTVCVEHCQAGVHRLVLLHVLFEWKMGHQNRQNLSVSTACHLTEVSSFQTLDLCPNYD